MGEQLLSEVGQENMNPKDALQISKLLSSKGSRKQLVTCLWKHGHCNKNLAPRSHRKTWVTRMELALFRAQHCIVYIFTLIIHLILVQIVINNCVIFQLINYVHQIDVFLMSLK